MRSRLRSMRRIVHLLGCALLCASLAVAQTDRSSLPHPIELSGRIVDLQGRPIGGAAVVVLSALDRAAHSLEWTVDDVLARPMCRADDGGEFRTFVQPDWLLLVAAPGRLAMEVRGSALLEARGGHVRLGDVVLPEGAVHTGTLRDPEGRPVVGARIRAVSFVGPAWSLGGVTQRSWTATRSDEQGAYRLRGAPWAGLRLAITADGFHDAWVAAPRAGTPSELVLTRSGHVSGRVVDAEGAPVPGILLEARYEASADDLLPSFRTDAEGRFRITRQGHGRMRIRGVDPATRRAVASDVLEAPSDDVVLTLPGKPGRMPPRIRVRVVDAVSGRPVAGARLAVAATRRTATDPRPPYLPAAGGPWDFGDCPTTDAEGRVVLDVAPITSPRAELRVRSTGHAAWFGDVELGDRTAEIEIRLQREAIVAGRVVDSAGEPVVGADVLWLQRGAADGVQIGFVGGLAPNAARTDAAGRYELRGLPRAELDVLASAPGLGSSSAAFLDMGSEPRAVADLELPAGREIVLRLPPDRSDDDLVATFAYSLAPRRGGGRGPQLYLAQGAGLGLRFGPEGLLRWRFDAGQQIGPSLARLTRGTTVPAVLRFPLANLEAGGDVEVRVTEEQLATGRVVGRCRVAPEHFGRFTIELREGWVRPQDAARFRIPLDAEGGFTFESRPGRFHLEVADLVTGITLHRHSGPVELGPGQRVELDLEPGLVPVRVDLLPREGAGMRSLVGRVQFSYRTPEPDSSWESGDRIPTWDGRRSFELLLPLGHLRVQLHDGALGLTANGTYRGGDPTTAEFEITAAPGQRYELSLPAPTPLADLDR